jgi:signal transduction histidine kinase
MNQQTTERDWLIVGTATSLIAGLFVLDVYTPLGVASHVLYLIPVIVAFASPTLKLPLIITTLCSILVLVGAVLSPKTYDMPLWIPLSNRIFGMFVLWVPVWFFINRRQAEAALARLNDELEDRVRQRTKELAQVNEALVEEISERMETEQALRGSESALEANRQELRGLAAQLLRVQEEERQRVSRELHDDVNQRLAMLTVDVETLERQLPDGSETVGRGLRSIQDRLAELSDDVRHLAYEYHPSILDDLGLAIALQRLVDEFALRTGITGSFKHGDVSAPLPQPVASGLYRIAQESLGNIVKHAKASQVDVVLSQDQDGVSLSVRDNGMGFRSDEGTSRSQGLGFISMKERVRLVNGTLSIESQPGRGTRLQVWVPARESQP